MNTLSIRNKLFIAIFLACALAVSAGAGLYYFRIEQAFQQYRQALDENYLDTLVPELVNFYERYNTWQPLTDKHLWRDLLRVIGRQARQTSPARPGGAAINSRERHPPRDHLTPFRIVLYDADNRYVQGRRQNIPHNLRLELKQGENTIGYLGLYPRRGPSNAAEDKQFFRELNKTLLLVALLTLVASFGIALLLSRRLVKPIQSLRRSSSELANGNYAIRISVDSHDELGLLSEDFNRLAETLQKHEQDRRQWIMDIAHELRTPLSILRGEIEAIQDGISQAGPETIHSLHQEAVHLQRLVEDLYTLSVSDSGSLTYHKNRQDVAVLLQDSLSQFNSRLQEKNLTLHTDIQQPAWCHADAQRLQQLFKNLLRNSLRYTDAPGKLQVSLHTGPDQVIIHFEDSAPGVPEQSLPRLFERLYRVESSRSRATGGAGIGLSICYNIVQAHGGQISAHHAALGGLKVTITLPCKPDNTKK